MPLQLYHFLLGLFFAGLTTPRPLRATLDFPVCSGLSLSWCLFYFSPPHCFPPFIEFSLKALKL